MRVYVRKFDWDEAARLYESGVSGTELARRYHVQHAAVYNALRKLGVECRNTATSVRPDALRCVTCHEWKSDEDFPLDAGGRKARRGRHKECRPCGTISRQKYREQRKVPCIGCGKAALPPGEKAGRSPFPRCRDCYNADRKRERVAA